MINEKYNGLKYIKCIEGKEYKELRQNKCIQGYGIGKLNIYWIREIQKVESQVEGVGYEIF